MNKVSIIIPVYNGAKYINRCLHGVLNQDYSNLEIIVVDDGSTDETLHILENYKFDERVKVISKENGGVSSARNVGLQYVTGQFINFIDCDDSVDSHYISCLLEPFLNKKCDLSVCGYQVINNYQDVIQSFPSQFKFFENFQKGCISLDDFLIRILLPNSIKSTLWNKMFSVNLIKGLTFDERIIIGEDLLFLTKYALRCKSIYFIPYAGYNYLLNNDGAMKKIRFAHSFQDEWLTEWSAIKEFDLLISENKKNNNILYQALVAKKLIISEKLIKKMRETKFIDVYEYKEMSQYIKKVRFQIWFNRFVNFKWKMKLFYFSLQI